TARLPLATEAAPQYEGRAPGAGEPPNLALSGSTPLRPATALSLAGSSVGRAGTVNAIVAGSISARPAIPYSARPLTHIASASVPLRESNSVRAGTDCGTE